MIAAFARALPDTPLPSSWEPLFGGRTNMAWRGICEGAPDVVLKLYRGAAQNPLFPNDPAAETQLLKILATHPMAPHFCASFEAEDGQCNVYEHLPGRVWKSDTKAVAALMLDLHRIPPPTGLRQVADGSSELRTQIESILSRCSTAPDLLSQLPTGDIAPSGRRVLLHSDIVPGNLIENDKGLHLIDWQCPAIGDPCEDIAIFLSPAMQFLYRGIPLNQAEIERFFDAYDDAATATRYQSLAPFYHARIAAYCQWQMEHGQPEYCDGLQLEMAALQRSLKA
ncbi:phosphotransferase [Shimia sp. R9_2]|uniref:phosphotransferase family protein n=1 Tax=Shimia sp. R9_2 TaxID=2821112 RepID=UPI0032AF4AB9